MFVMGSITTFASEKGISKEDLRAELDRLESVYNFKATIYDDEVLSDSSFCFGSIADLEKVLTEAKEMNQKETFEVLEYASNDASLESTSVWLSKVYYYAPFAIKEYIQVNKVLATNGQYVFGSVQQHFASPYGFQMGECSFTMFSESTSIIDARRTLNTEIYGEGKITGSVVGWPVGFSWTVDETNSYWYSVLN